MGWSELAVAPEIDAIFKKTKLKYRVRRVLQPGTNPVVQILHEGKLDVSQIKEILELFPELVYVEFVFNSVFTEGDEGDSYDWGEEVE